MRVLTDNRVAASLSLDSRVRPSGAEALSAGVFDIHLRPMELLATVQQFRPDVVVVDPVWLSLSALLTTLLDLSDAPHARRVIGATRVDDVLKVRGAHHGYFDIVELDQPSESVIAHLSEIHAGDSRLDDDRLWTHVPQPRAMTNVAPTPEDDVDRAILELISIGLPDREIAATIHVSHQTVRNRISALLGRSGLANRTQMAWTYTNQTLVTRLLENLTSNGQL